MAVDCRRFVHTIVLLLHGVVFLGGKVRCRRVALAVASVHSSGIAGTL